MCLGCKNGVAIEVTSKNEWMINVLVLSDPRYEPRQINHGLLGKGESSRGLFQEVGCDWVSFSPKSFVAIVDAHFCKSIPKSP